MKKLRITAFLLIFSILIGLFSLSLSEEKTKKSIRFGIMKGATGVGAAGLLRDKRLEEMNLSAEISIFPNPEAILTAFARQELDFALMPQTLAAILFNKTKNIRLLSTNSLNVLYVAENGDSIREFKDLSEKSIASSGKGATPDIVLEYLIKQNGMTDKKPKIEYFAEASELAGVLIGKKADIAVIPEPILTSVLKKSRDTRLALDLGEEWAKINPSARLISSVLVANADFIEQNKAVCDGIIELHKRSIALANENPERTGEICEEMGILKKAVIAGAIPRLGLEFHEGEDMKRLVSEYIKIIFEANPKALGERLPEDSFYYAK